MWRGGQWGNHHPLVGRSVNVVVGWVRGRLTAQNATPALEKGNLNSTSRCQAWTGQDLTTHRKAGPCRQGLERGPGHHSIPSLSSKSTHFARHLPASPPDADNSCIALVEESAVASIQFSIQFPILTQAHALLRATPRQCTHSDSF